MIPVLLLAAALLVFVAAAHSFLGERYILVRLFRRADLPKLLGSDAFTKQTLRFAWHLTSVAWLGFAGLLAAQAVGGSTWRVQQRLIAGTFALSAAAAGAGSRGRHLSWIVFLAVAALVWVA
ncbi:MAG TPA: hypothetical protein VIG50_18740 [Vicinamibacteria bacterium]|jgi:hypothetical protein